MSQVKVLQDVEYKTGALRAHHRFYIADGDIEIQVNNALFRVHRHFLVKHSTVLHDTFSAPGPDCSKSPVKGAHPDDVVRLSGDSVGGWECLLGLFYSDNPCQPPEYRAEEWAAIVLLANKYVMDGVEEGALKQLRKAKPPLRMVQLVILAQKVDSKELYQEALHSLAKQPELLSFDDAQSIGIKAFYDVMKEERVIYRRNKNKEDLAWLRDPFGAMSPDEELDISSAPAKRKRVGKGNR